MTTLEPFANQQYLNLETFRKNGAGVRTPVWFVQDGDTLYVRTVAGSGKVKRIRKNASVNIAPCKVDGALLGDWIAARAVERLDPDAQRHVDRLLDQKYGLMKKMFALASALQRREYTVLELKASQS